MENQPKVGNTFLGSFVVGFQRGLNRGAEILIRSVGFRLVQLMSSDRSHRKFNISFP